MSELQVKPALLLRENGFRAQALNGGFPRWEATGLPVERAARE
jgi:rhodanese-related sulfurtransferase